jgi:hypothetical protein
VAQEIGGNKKLKASISKLMKARLSKLTRKESRDEDKEKEKN